MKTSKSRIKLEVLIALFSISCASAQIKERTLFQQFANADTGSVRKLDVRFDALLRSWYWKSLEVKGRVFAIKHVGPLILFRDSSLKDKSGYEFRDHNYWKDNASVCSMERGFMCDGRESIKCSLYSCSHMPGHCIRRSYPKGFLGINTDKLAAGNPCPFTNLPTASRVVSEDFIKDTAPDYYQELFHGFEGTLIKFEEVNQKEKWIKVNFDGVPRYIDISFCFGKESPCQIWDLKISLHEYQQLKLAQTKKDKSNKRLNFLISELLPCVKKRDSLCVSKFFLKKEETEISHLDDEGAYWPGDKTKFDEDDFKELESCLSYDGLMAHPYFLKGRKKACIFNYHYRFRNRAPGIKDTDRFMTIDYPEAFSSNYIDSGELPHMWSVFDGYAE